MVTKLLNFRKGGWFASFAVLICLTWAGVNFGTQTQAAFVETDVALENAIAGSEGLVKRWAQVRCGSGYGYYEICFYSGDGNTCSTYLDKTREC